MYPVPGYIIWLISSPMGHEIEQGWGINSEEDQHLLDSLKEWECTALIKVCTNLVNKNQSDSTLFRHLLIHSLKKLSIPWWCPGTHWSLDFQTTSLGRWESNRLMRCTSLLWLQSMDIHKAKFFKPSIAILLHVKINHSLMIFGIGGSVISLLIKKYNYLIEPSWILLTVKHRDGLKNIFQF